MPVTNTKNQRHNSLEKGNFFSQIKKAEINIPKTSVFIKNKGFILTIIFYKKTDHDQQFTNMRNGTKNVRVPQKGFLTINMILTNKKRVYRCD